MEDIHMLENHEVKTKNIFKRMREAIISRYADHSYLAQQQAWYLFVVGILVVVMQIVTCFALISASGAEARINFVGSITTLIVAAFALFLILGKKYKIAAVLALTIMVINMTIVFAATFFYGKNLYQGFTTNTYGVFPLIVFGALFCKRKAVVLTAGWFAAVFILYFVMAQGKVSKEMIDAMEVALPEIIINMVIVSVFSFLIVTVMDRTTSNLVDSVSNVREASTKLIRIADDIDTSSKELAEGAAGQAAAIQETSASLKEISERIKKDAEIVMGSQTLMDQTTKTVLITNKSLNDLRQSMDEVNEASIKTARIIKTIDAIAFQTNLLALNAAVEAARAGEAGAGFAVVADEVRNLAQRSAEASKSTQEIIGASIENIKKSVVLAVSSDEAFSTFTKTSAELAERLKIIAEHAQQQARGISGIESATAEMNQVIQNNAARADETAAISSELSTMSNEIEIFVARLDKLTK